MDAENREIERKAALTNDPMDAARAQAARDRAGVTSDDAEYLLAYLRINDRFVEREITEREANEALAALNLNYLGRVKTGTLRDTLAVLDALAGRSIDDDGLWMRSGPCS